MAILYQFISSHQSVLAPEILIVQSRHAPTIRFVTIEHMSADPAGPGSAHHCSVEGAEWFGSAVRPWSFHMLLLLTWVSYSR